MKKSTKLVIAVVVIIIIVLIVVQSSTQKTKISIGAVVPQTGFGAYWGKPELNGIKLAEMDLKKEYGENNVSIFIEDGQSAIPASVSAAQKLLSVNKVDLIYSEFSGPSAAISPVVKNAGKTFVYSTFNQKIADDNERSIKTFVSFEVACEKFAKDLNDSSKKVLIISSIGDVAPYCERALLKVLPKENVKTVDGFIGTDFRTLLLQNKSFAPDYIIPVMYEDGSFALIKQKVELGLKSNIFGYRQDSMTEKILKDLPVAYTEGIVFFEMPIDKGFNQRIKTAYPEMTDDDIQAAANAYQSMMAAGVALAQCPGADSACVVSKISDIKDFEFAGYQNASFVNRILTSDLSFGVVKNGVAVVE